jgi:hypothetical protein
MYDTPITIRRYTSFDDMKADEYRYWQSRPAQERMDAIEELNTTAYELKGMDPHPEAQTVSVRSGYRAHDVLNIPAVTDHQLQVGMVQHSAESSVAIGEIVQNATFAAFGEQRTHQHGADVPGAADYQHGSRRVHLQAVGLYFEPRP